MKYLFTFLPVLFLITSCNYQADKVDVSSKNDNQKTSLTLMIYMAADNDLESYALKNLKQLEAGKTGSVNVLVLLDRSEGYDETDGNWTDTRLFEVLHADGSESSLKSKRLDCPALGLTASSATELDMADSSVLQGFIEFSKASYVAEEYALIIWGHGTGWKAFAIDDRTSSYMSVKELGQAVRDQGLGVIAFDTCFGGVLENVYEYKDSADFTVACPGGTPNSGWNYKKLMEEISGGEFTSQKIASAMAMCAAADTTVFDNSKLGDLFTSFEAFSKALSDTVNDSDRRSLVLSELTGIKSYCYSQNPCDIYLDIFSMAELYTAAEDSELSGASQNLKEAVIRAAISKEKGIGIHLIPKSSSGAMAALHSLDYVKADNRTDQSSFIKESRCWVPTQAGNSGSLLDKLFYTGL